MSEAGATASTPLLEIKGARATIRLNRPKHLNRLQPDDLDVLLKLFDRIEADPAIRVLVLTGTGRAFSAGYDLGSIAERADGNDEERQANDAARPNRRFRYRCSFRPLRHSHALSRRRR